FFFFFFSSRRRHTRSYGDWSSDVCSSDLENAGLHSVGGIVDLAQSLIEIPVRLDADDGSENLLAVYFHVGLSAGQNRGLDDEVKIGRASCRERGWRSGEEGDVKKKSRGCK